MVENNRFVDSSTYYTRYLLSSVFNVCTEEKTKLLLDFPDTKRASPFFLLYPLYIYT